MRTIKNWLTVPGALALVFSLTGCAIGYNTALFTTKSNVGVDADMKPPTLEVSIARREGVIEPTFEAGKTPPVMASFKVGSGFYVPPFAAISSTFAGGDAAVIMASLYASPVIGQPSPAHDSTLWLKKEPSGKVLGMFSANLHTEGESHPFLFGTDSSFGLKAAWSGLTAQFPDTVRLGMHRKEMAAAPVYGVGRTNVINGETYVYAVKMPSFLATLDNASSLGTVTNTSLKHLQYFATGLAAERLALQPAVREAMVSRMDPVAANVAFKRKFSNTDAAKRLRAWVNAPDPNTRKDRQQKIKDWIPADAGFTFFDLLYREDLNSEAERFLSEKGTEYNIP